MSTALKPFCRYEKAAGQVQWLLCKNFILHLKETEFRYNHRRENLLPIVKKLMKFP